MCLAIVIGTERIERIVGGFRVSGTVTRVWDKQAAASIRESMMQVMMMTVATGPACSEGRAQRAPVPELQPGP
jgi:membrane peptidoglycan carboxypeptidase